MSESMRDDLNAALDAAAENDETADFEETPQEVLIDETPEEVSEEVVEDETLETPEVAETPEEPTAEAEAPVDETEDKPDTRSIKAPMDWGPKEREDWSKIPPHLQKKITAREAEMQTAMANTSDARRTHEDMGRLANTYGAALSGVAGNSPMEVVENLFSTVANLRMGSPIQKAQIITDLVNDYGVDIHALDAALTGTVPEANSNAHLESLIDQRMQPVQQFLSTMQTEEQHRQQQLQQTAVSEVQQFAQNAEFIADVRNDMADLIEMAGQRGYTMPMDEAYNKACALNPQIQEVLTQRQQQAALTGNNNTMASKRAAASSLSGTRVGTGAGAGALSMRDQIAAAWDDHGE